MRLIAVGRRERAVEGIGMRPRQDRERCDPLGMAMHQSWMISAGGSDGGAAGSASVPIRVMC